MSHVICHVVPDLLKSIKQETEIDFSNLKINVIAIIGIILSLGFSFFIHRAYQLSGDLTLNIIAALVLSVLFLVTVFLQSIFIKDIGRIGTILFLEASVMLIPFIFLLSGFLFIGLLLTFLFLFWGSYSSRNELQYSMKARIFRLSKFVLPKAITGLSIFVAASYLSTFQDQGLVVKEETFRRIVLPAEAIVKVVMPGISLEDSFVSTIEKTNPDIQELSKEQKEEIIKKQQERFSKLLQYNFESRDALINILYNSYILNAKKVSESRKVLVLFALGAGLFLLAKSVGTPISWLVASMAVVIYEILIALGFVVVVLETRSKEIVLLK